MNKINLSFCILFLALFTGCSKKSSELNYFEKDPLSANIMQYTKKTDLIYKNKVKAMLFATYLNNIDKKYESKEFNSFIIGIHLVNKDNHELDKNSYKLSLNNKKYTKIKSLENNSELVQSIPLKNNWAKYYLVNFKNEKEVKNLNLKLTHSTFGQIQLGF